MPADHVLWINAGGTIISKPYADPRNPPDPIEPLAPAQADALIDRFIEILDREGRLASFSGKVRRYPFGVHYAYEDEDGTFVKDSAKFDSDDVETLADIIARSEEKYIIVNCGTSSGAKIAADTGAQLSKRGITGKSVFFSGLMVPLSMSMEGDAKLFEEAKDNFHYAFTQFGEQAPGTYIIGMNEHGRRACMDPAAVVKDKDKSLKTLAFTLAGR